MIPIQLLSKITYVSEVTEPHLVVCKDCLDPICYPKFPKTFRGCNITLISIQLNRVQIEYYLSLYIDPWN